MKEPPSKKVKSEPAEAPKSNVKLEQCAPPGDVSGEPPLVMRVDQWAQKPKAKAKPTAKCKAASKAKAKAKAGRKKKVETIEVVESGDETLEEAPAASSQEKPAAKAKGAPGRKRACSKDKGAAKAKAKSKGKAAQEDEKDDKDEKYDKDDAKPDAKKEPPIKYKPVTQDGKTDINTAFQWDQEEGVTSGDGADCHPGECEEGGADPGDDRRPLEPAVGKKSFARRPPPKTSPAKDRYNAIRDIFASHVCPHLHSLGMPIYQWEAW